MFLTLPCLKARRNTHRLLGTIKWKKGKARDYAYDEQFAKREAKL
jgi:hypothetical protein